jgi:membrane-associated protease RseP (regulator of RpoE activity)
MNFNLDGPFVAIMNTTSAPVWNPTVNPKIAGERSVSPTVTSGIQPGDNITAPGAGSWLFDDQITPKFSLVPSDIGPTSVTVTFQTDQGVVNP